MWLTTGESERLFTQNELIFVTVYSFFILIFFAVLAAQKVPEGKRGPQVSLGMGPATPYFRQQRGNVSRRRKIGIKM